nr:hypothetical protein [Planctomycetota bacterium]
MNQQNFFIGKYDSQSDLDDAKRPVEIGFDTPLFVMAGPCVIESKENCIEIAEKLLEVSEKTNVPAIFKAS